MFENLKLPRFGEKPLINTGKAKRILNVGCGDGKHLEELLGRMKNGSVICLEDVPSHIVEAIDRNKEAIMDGRCRLIRGTPENMPFSSNTFDVATAVNTFSTWKDTEKAVKQIYRVLDEDGTFLVLENDEYKNPMGKNPYKDTEIYNMLEKAGFEDIMVRRKGHWLSIAGRKPIKSGYSEKALFVSGWLTEHTKILAAIGGALAAIAVFLFSGRNKE